MTEVPQEKPSRVRLLVLALTLIIAGAVGFSQVGNPVTMVLEWWNPTISAPTSNGLVTLPSVFRNSPWSELMLHGRLPIVVDAKGRKNPFIGVPAIPNLADRDARRLLDVRAIRDALRAHVLTYGQYPSGNEVIIGSGSAACLTEKGWEPRSACVFGVGVVPVPADPGDDAYRYEATGASYALRFILETDTAGYKAGEHTLTPQGIE